jgi:hypothetical protein
MSLRALLVACTFLVFLIGAAGAHAHGGETHSDPSAHSDTGTGATSADSENITRQATFGAGENTVHLGFHSDPVAALPEDMIENAVGDRPSLASPSFTEPPQLGRAQLPEQTALPETWCGAAPGTLAAGRASADDTINAVYLPSTPVFKVIYAYANGSENRFDTFKHRLQANVSLLSRYMAQQSWARKTVRFDMGTICGPQYVDIQVVALPRVREEYVIGGAPQFGTLAADVRTAIGSPALPRNYVVYADGLRGSNGVAGTGEFYYGPAAESPTSPWHDAGRLLSAVWGPQTAGTGPYADPTTMMHEMGHNMGAVQGNAPNTSGVDANSNPVGHCNDEQDLMCYADGGSRGRYTDMVYRCPYDTGAMNETFDCNNDDYFNPEPAPGSFLASRWNTFNSAMLGSCADELQSSCDVPGEPVNTTPTAGRGWYRQYTVAMTANPGTVFQWRVDSGTVQTTAIAAVSGTGTRTLATRVGDSYRRFSVWREETVRVDDTVPTATVICPSGWQTVRPTCTIRAADNVELGAVHVRVNDRPVDRLPADTSTVEVSGEGVMSVQVRAEDHVGNLSAWNTTTVRADLTDPTASIICDGGAWSAGQCTVSASDAGSGITSLTYTIDGNAPVAVTNGASVAVPHGVHTVKVTAADGVGRTASVQRTVNVDSTPPVAAVSCPDAWSPAPVVCAVSVSDSESSVSEQRYRISGVVGLFVGDTFTVAGEGVQQVAVQARNGAGTWSAWSADTSVRIDTLAPTVTLHCALEDPAAARYVCQMNATDSGSGVAAASWQLGDGPERPAATVWSVAGPGLLTVYAVDGVGRRGTASMTLAAPGGDTQLPSGQQPDPPSQKPRNVPDPGDGQLTAGSVQVPLRGRLRAQASVRWTPAGSDVRVTVSLTGRKAARGRYRANVCVLARASRPVCRTKRVNVRRAGRLPRTTVRLTARTAAGARVKVTVQRQQGRRWKTVSSRRVSLSS